MLKCAELNMLNTLNALNRKGISENGYEIMLSQILPKSPPKLLGLYIGACNDHTKYP